MKGNFKGSFREKSKNLCFHKWVIHVVFMSNLKVSFRSVLFDLDLFVLNFFLSL